MAWFLVDFKITLILLAWIISCVGVGNLALLILQNRLKSRFLDESFALFSLLALLFGVAIFSILGSILHIFIALDSKIAILFLIAGIIAFCVRWRDFYLNDWRVLFSAFLAFGITSILACFHDSMGDSVNYHMQIVAWIRESPLVFGLGNIHGRLGFNGVIYNFYALSDVSQIFPNLRSFIGNEVVYFGLIFSVILVLLRRDLQRFSHIFLVCSALFFSFILKHGEFRGLYCEGIGAVLGICIVACALEILVRKNNAFLAILFLLGVFSAMVKIANTALLAIIALVFIYQNRDFYRAKFYKSYAILAAFSALITLAWAIKGIATSGMIAYPASVGFFKSLEFAVSEAQRES